METNMGESPSLTRNTAAARLRTRILTGLLRDGNVLIRLPAEVRFDSDGQDTEYRKVRRAVSALAKEKPDALDWRYVRVRWAVPEDVPDDESWGRVARVFLAGLAKPLEKPEVPEP